MCGANIVNADFIDGHVALIEFLREEKQIRIYAAGNASDERVKFCRKMLYVCDPHTTEQQRPLSIKRRIGRIH